MVKFFSDLGAPWSTKVFKPAAYNGLGMVTWLRENGCPWDEEACAAAARAGNLPVLKWMRSQGCPWDTRVFSFAAQEGNVHILEWAFQNGCPFTRDAILDATSNGQKSAILWFLEKIKNHVNSATVATERGHFNLLSWFMDRGDFVPSVVFMGIRKCGDPRILEKFTRHQENRAQLFGRQRTGSSVSSSSAPLENSTSEETMG